MAMTQDNVRALDQLRQRLHQLSTSISSLRADLERNEPLPTWPSLQTSAQALSFNLQQLSDTFESHRQFLKEAHAYPLPEFPGHTQEDLLGQLLRKKLEPGAEDWIEEYTTKFAEKDRVQGDEAVQFKELWGWAGEASANIVEPMLEDGGAFDDDFTIAEREAGVETVVTGLKRRLDGDDEDDDGDDDEEADGDGMEDVVPGKARLAETAEEEGIDKSLPPLSMESMVRFTTTGMLPAGNAQAAR